MSTVIGSATIDRVLHGAVESGAVPNVAAIAANREGVIYEGAAGPRAVGASDPVSVDTMFRIMSMTKMVCTVAALQQVEKGTLNLNAPVADYCPEFARLQVLEGFDGDTPKLRPPASQATVKQLMTHTTGLGWARRNEPGWQAASRLVRQPSRGDRYVCHLPRTRRRRRGNALPPGQCGCYTTSRL